MADNPSEPRDGERRNLQSAVSDMRVDVGQIKTRLEVNTATLTRLEAKLDLGVFRTEYERRHQDLENEVIAARKETELVRDDYLRRQGAQRAWRWLYGAAIAVLGLVEIFFRH